MRKIVEGISEGVYSAVTAAMRNSNNSDTVPFALYMDGEAIYNGVVNKDKQRIKQTGRSALAN